jgi:transposase
MDDIIYCPSSTFLSQKFALNSYNRIVARRGIGRKPESSLIGLQALSGRKCSNLDLSIISQSFSNFRKAVNLILERVYSDLAYANTLGEELDKSPGKMYVVLRKENRLKWKLDNEFGKLVFERMHRNALETAARMILTDYTRRRLVTSLVNILASDEEQLLRLMTNRRIPSDLARKLKDTIGKKSGGSYHYALSACRQVRKVLNLRIRDEVPSKNGERRPSTRELLEQDLPNSERTKDILFEKIIEWRNSEFPFSTPLFQKDTMDFAASTENTTVQGYWFMPDKKRENEIVLYVKTPPGVLGHEQDSTSPYKSQTVRFRFLNWLPLKAERARRKAKEARERGNIRRATTLEFRAVRFEDMNQQLVNTILIQQYTRELAKERAPSNQNKERIEELKVLIDKLKRTRKTAPPKIKLVGNKATLIIPFMSPDENILKILPHREKLKRKAGVDRGLRHSMVVSVKNGDDDYSEQMIGRQDLFEKREKLRQQTRVLMSQIAKRRNNWEKKHPELPPPAPILKKERELGSVWKKIRRLDDEIAHQVASETVWFCEHHGAKTVYFEDLRSFRAKGGMRTHSWNLSTNLWGKMIEKVRYRREMLGHYNGGIWLVNPAWTSQTCHVCGERGVRVEDETSMVERKGGEYFHCSKCDEHFHADVNAARNIMHVKQVKPSAVPGRSAL